MREPHHSNLQNTAVKLASELMPGIEWAIEHLTNEFGGPLFRSRRDVVTKAVQDFLLKNGWRAKRANSRRVPMEVPVS